MSEEIYFESRACSVIVSVRRRETTAQTTQQYEGSVTTRDDAALAGECDEATYYFRGSAAGEVTAQMQAWAQRRGESWGRLVVDALRNAPREGWPPPAPWGGGSKMTHGRAVMAKG